MSNGDDETIASGGGDETVAAGAGGGGGDATQIGGTPPREPDEPGQDRKPWLIALAILIVGLIIGAGVAVAGGGGDDKDENASTSTSSSSTSTSSSTTPTTGATATTNSGGQPSNDPFINSLANTGSNPATCTEDQPPGMFDSPSDPYQVTISWTTTNATQTVLSVDGPGVYGTYGPSGSESFSYDCQTQSHTFTVTAKGPDGPDAVRTLTLQINKGP